MSLIKRMKSGIMTDSYEVNIFRFASLFHVTSGLGAGVILNYFIWQKMAVYAAALWYAVVVISGTLWYERSRLKLSTEDARHKVKDKASKVRMLLGALPANMVVILSTGGIQSPAIWWIAPSIAAAVLVMGDKGGKAAGVFGLISIMIASFVSYFSLGQGYIAFVMMGYHISILAVSYASIWIFYSQTLTYQKKLQKEREAALFELQTVKIFLDNKDMAAAVFDKTGKLLKSSALYERVVGKDKGIDAIFTLIPKDQKETAETVLTGSLGEDVINWEANEDNLPKSLLINGERYNVSWQPVLKNDSVNGIVFIATNIEELEKAKKAAERAGEIGNLLHNIVEIGRQKIGLFLMYGHSLLEAKSELIEMCKINQLDDKLKQRVYIKLHTAKGVARTYGFAALATALHEVEGTLETPADALQKIEIAINIFSEINDLCEKINFNQDSSFNKEEALAVLRSSSPEKIESFIKGKIFKKLQDVLEGFKVDVEANAKKIGKPLPALQVYAPEFYVAEITEKGDNVQKCLNDAFIHIIRNALDHGIESPDVRTAAGKPENGRLIILVQQRGQKVEMIVSDDGRGLDLQAIKKKAVEKGILKSEENDCHVVANTIFEPEFSTASQVTEFSGRGVGMGAVREAIEKLGGTVKALPLRHGCQQSPWNLVIELPTDILFV